jgi:hypothetical protein
MRGGEENLPQHTFRRACLYWAGFHSSIFAYLMRIISKSFLMLRTSASISESDMPLQDKWPEKMRTGPPPVAGKRSLWVCHHPEKWETSWTRPAPRLRAPPISSWEAITSSHSAASRAPSTSAVHRPTRSLRTPELRCLGELSADRCRQPHARCSESGKWLRHKRRPLGNVCPAAEHLGLHGCRCCCRSSPLFAPPIPRSIEGRQECGNAPRGRGFQPCCSALAATAVHGPLLCWRLWSHHRRWSIALFALSDSYVDPPHTMQFVSLDA